MDPTTTHAAAEVHVHPRYFLVAFILLIVTILEVIAAKSLGGNFKWMMLVAMALFKAAVVALYFMHLKFERKTMWIIASAPLIFGAILYCGATPDSDHTAPHVWHHEAPAEKHG